MTNVYFDIRGSALKVLMTDGQAVNYTKIFDMFSLENKDEARKTLLQVSNESGIKLGAVHLIPPSGEIKIKTYKLQKMSIGDARMIVRRKIMVEEGIADPVFHLLPRYVGERHQEFVAAIISPEVLKRYVTLFAGFGINVITLSSSFHANLRAFEQSKSELPQTCAVFEVGRDSIEIMVVSPSQIVTYETVPVAPEEEDESPEKPDAERAQKKRLYAIIDALYKFMLSYRELYSDMPIEKVLLCGRSGNRKNMAEAIEEGIGIQSSLWNPFGGSVPDGAEFSALYGFAAGVSDGTAVNLISDEFRKRKRYIPGRTVKAAVFFLYIAMLASIVFIFETRYENAKEMLNVEMKEKQALDLLSERAGLPSDLRETLRKGPERQTPLYEVFRYLGNNLPDGVSLSEVVFKQEGADETLSLKFEGKYDVAIGKKRYFTRLIASLNGSGRLSVIKEPSFSVSDNEKDPRIHFQILCKVIPYEKNK